MWKTGRSTSYWLYGGFQLPAVELVPCCPLVHTLCPSAASPRSLHPGWLLPAACVDSAAHAETHRCTITPQQSNIWYFKTQPYFSHHSLESHKPIQLFTLYIFACRTISAHHIKFLTTLRFSNTLFALRLLLFSLFSATVFHPI